MTILTFTIFTTDQQNNVQWDEHQQRSPTEGEAPPRNRTKLQTAQVSKSAWEVRVGRRAPGAVQHLPYFLLELLPAGPWLNMARGVMSTAALLSEVRLCSGVQEAPCMNVVPKCNDADTRALCMDDKGTYRVVVHIEWVRPESCSCMSLVPGGVPARCYGILRFRMMISQVGVLQQRICNGCGWLPRWVRCLCSL